MKKLFAVGVMLAALVIVVGFYRGWFALSSPSPDAGSNQVNINLTMNPDQVKADAESVKEKTAELTGKARKGANELGDQTNDSQ